MTRLIFHHNLELLPTATKNQIPVQLYGLGSQSRKDVSIIGNPVIDRIKRLGVALPSTVMDFLTLALAVTAADTFVRRTKADDGWTRQFTLELPLLEPNRWNSLKEQIERSLLFLSGDIWNLEFQDGGYPPPAPYESNSRYHLVQLLGIDCVSLFSGGLDSAIGAINLLADGQTPLFVSHAYKSDKKHQDHIAEKLQGQFSRFEVNADPHLYNGETDITMRTRSFNFLAFAAIAAWSVLLTSKKESVEIFVPENGFISLNAPLTPRRNGTLSTRTTHPHFIASVQTLFNKLGFPFEIKNPYQSETKGNMVTHCKNKPLLAEIVDNTVSCSHWKRKNKQCGICVPCIIRRAALYAGEVKENTEYEFEKITDVMSDPKRRDDLLALSIAVAKKDTHKLGSWILDSGPLPQDSFDDFLKVFSNGLNEIEVYLKSVSIL